MPRTCIICGGPTGSREHLFPAALGGRRTNKGIYCSAHNNAYAGLAGIISTQLAVFNAQLGIVGDHSSVPTSVTLTDVNSGQEIEMSSSQLRFKHPQIRSERTEEGKTIVEMAFSSRKEAEEWAAEQKEKGINVEFIDKGRKSRYHLGTAHKQISLGHTEEGLRSIAYIAQTFFAHSFPEQARSSEMRIIKDYTLNNTAADLIWWDFDPPNDLPENKFPFGHRVIVGTDSEHNTAYARISFFSALNFSIILADLPVEVSKAVVTDIDPLAKAPPKDIHTSALNTSLGAVTKPNQLNAGLADAISSGKAVAILNDLMRRITDFERNTAAAKIMEQIESAMASASGNTKAVFTEITLRESQRVLNLMSYLAKDLKNHACDPVRCAMAEYMEQASKLDPTTENGLSDHATRSLEIACNSLANQMYQDWKDGKLDHNRVSMLIGGGPGVATIGSALLHIFAQRFPDR